MKYIKKADVLPDSSVEPQQTSQETGDQICVEFVQRFENDIGMFLDEADTVEEKMAKIE